MRGKADGGIPCGLIVRKSPENIAEDYNMGQLQLVGAFAPLVQFVPVAGCAAGAAFPSFAASWYPVLGVRAVILQDDAEVTAVALRAFRPRCCHP